MWEHVNGLYLRLKEARTEGTWSSRPHYLSRLIIEGVHLFQGITHGTMTHNEAWHFIRLGTMLERADKTTRILDVKYYILLPSVSDVGTPYDDIQWAAVLKSVSAFEMYRKRFGRISPDRIVEFLLLDPEFPRAVRYCTGFADQSLHAITGTRPGTFACSAEQRQQSKNEQRRHVPITGYDLDCGEEETQPGWIKT